jgi:hypothetical protein
MLLSGEVERRQASKPEDASHPEFTATLRLHPLVSDSVQDRFVGSRDGYVRLCDPVTHRRGTVYDKAARSFGVTDHLDGRAHCACAVEQAAAIVTRFTIDPRSNQRAAPNLAALRQNSLGQDRGRTR